MNAHLRKLLDLLERGRFAFPVAIYPGVDARLGEVLEADAFDVPAGRGPEVSQQLADLLWPAAFDEGTVLPGIRYDFESEVQRTALPPETVWYTPRSGSHARV
jgi:hypothetical protein